MQIITTDKFIKSAVLERQTYSVDPALARAVARIVADVKKNGDRALRRYTKKFDGVDVGLKRIRVREGDINRSYEGLDVGFIPLLKRVTERVRRFYRKEAQHSYELRSDEAVLESRTTPIRRVGIYIPGGTKPLVSTVYMTVLPAQLAGVKEIALVSPPTRGKDIDPHILAVASLLGVKEIYRAGGAQAISALAFGTRTIPRVDKIVGPGNPYVTEAKRQVYGFCDIDMVAGPSEVAIIADSDANPDWVVADLAAQGEHYLGQMFLVTNSRKLAEAVCARVPKGIAVLTSNLEEAARVTNLISPEHLQIMTRNPKGVLKHVRNAGAIFMGPYSPAVIGDYVAGPSHVLPTGGSARFYSSLGVENFTKRSHVISYTRGALEKVTGLIDRLTQIEGLDLHGESARVRFTPHQKAPRISKDD